MKYTRIVLGALIVSIVTAAETKLGFSDLPSAVQAAAKANLNGAEIVGASKEMEKGQLTYEVETKKAGKSRDLDFDASGKLLEVEQEVDLDSLPASAKAALQKRALGGTIQKVESVTAGNSASYEAVVLTKNGKQIEIAVNPDGTPHHD